MLNCLNNPSGVLFPLLSHVSSDHFYPSLFYISGHVGAGVGTFRGTDNLQIVQGV